MNIPAKSNPAARLRLCKSLMEITTADMADKLHISVSHLNKLLSGQKVMDTSMAIYIGKTLDIDSKWILYGGTLLPTGINNVRETAKTSLWTVSISFNGTSEPIRISVPAGTTKGRIRELLHRSKEELLKKDPNPSIQAVVANACWLQPGWHWEVPPSSLSIDLNEN